MVNGIFHSGERPLVFAIWSLSKGGFPSHPGLTIRPKEDKERPLCLSWGVYELFLIYFIDYAITVVPFFSPLYSPPPCTPSPSFPHLRSGSMNYNQVQL